MLRAVQPTWQVSPSVLPRSGRAAAALRRGSIPFVERGGRLVVTAREAINAVIEFVE